MALIFFQFSAFLVNRIFARNWLERLQAEAWSFEPPRRISECRAERRVKAGRGLLVRLCLGKREGEGEG